MSAKEMKRCMSAKGSLRESDFLDDDLRTGASSLCFLKLLDARLERTTELADDA